MTDVVETEKKSWLARLRGGLAKSTKRVTESITGLFTKISTKLNGINIP